MHFAQSRESTRVKNQDTLLHAESSQGRPGTTCLKKVWKYGGRVRKTRETRGVRVRLAEGG